MGRTGFTRDIMFSLFLSLPRFTSPPDASPHGKPWAVPSASLHAPRPAPATAAARTNLLLPSWSHEFWESWLPLPPRSTTPSAPSSPLFQHAGKLAVRLLPEQELLRADGILWSGGIFSEASWERMWSSWAAPWWEVVYCPPSLCLGRVTGRGCSHACCAATLDSIKV